MGIYATERKSCTGVPRGPFTRCCTCTVTPTFATSFDNFIATYHSLHVCSRQALLCARLAACHVPLVYTWLCGRGRGVGRDELTNDLVLLKI